MAEARKEIGISIKLKIMHNTFCTEKRRTTHLTIAHLFDIPYYLLAKCSTWLTTLGK